MIQRYKDNLKMSKPQDTHKKNLGILQENSAKGLKSRTECCWCFVVSVFEDA